MTPPGSASANCILGASAAEIAERLVVVLPLGGASVSCTYSALADKPNFRPAQANVKPEHVAARRTKIWLCSAEVTHNRAK
jgi:hypothetical protein